MLCRNCGNSLADNARFCAYCGVQQSVQPSSHPAFGETSVHSPMSDSALEASDVTIILPRRRANATTAAAAQTDDAASFPSAASTQAVDTLEPHPLRATALKIGGAAAIVIVAVFAAVAFYATRVATPAGKKEAPAVTATTAASTPMPSARNSEPDAAVAKAEAPSTPVVETVAAPVKENPVAEAPSAPDVTPPVPTQRTVTPSKDAAPRRRARPAAAAEPAPVETPPPQPVVIAPPTPAPETAPPPEPVKVETVACADRSNPFSREACLWQECAKPEFRSHAECARFTGPNGQR
jgi:hypothetical protein